MKTNYEIRYAAHPEDAKNYDTTRIRRDFLIEKIFVPNEVNMVYSNALSVYYNVVRILLQQKVTLSIDKQDNSR